MKYLRPVWRVAFLVLCLALLFPVPALAAEPGLIILGNTYTLSSNERLDENLTVLGGHVVIEQGAEVSGSILILGGTLQLDGLVEGNITAAGGVLNLGENAVVEGDISTAGATVWLAEGALVQGDVVSEAPDTIRSLRSNNLHMPFIADQLLSPLAVLTRALLAAALAVLAVMFLPQVVERVTGALMSQPVLCGGMGILTILVFPLAFVMAIITILLIPLGLLSLVVLALAYFLGWVALGYEVGRRIAAMFHWDWAPPVIAGIGTFVISLLLGGLGQIPCLGWVISFLVWHAGLGAVVLTRFGLQTYGRDLVSGSLNPNA